MLLSFTILLWGWEMTAFAGSLNPVYDSGTGTTVWDYVYFGSYPQTEITDEATISAIENAIKAEDAGTDHPVTGRSIWVDGTKYSRISASNITNTKYFGTDKQYRYFKWQRIKWKVLENNGDTLFLRAEQILDCQVYNETRQDVTWETSTLRSWLNGYGSTTGFLQTAFSITEQTAIVSTKVCNFDNTRYYTPGGNPTMDYIYLLSIDEMGEGKYGFFNSTSSSLAGCQTKTSDFAHARGTTTSTTTGKEGNGGWWLRSPGMYCYDAAYVNYGGMINSIGLIVPYDDMGVCPVLRVDFASYIWDSEDDGTSGDGGEERILTNLQATKTKTVYNQSESLNVDDLKVTASYSHISGNTQMELSNDAYTTNASTLDMNVPGNKTLIISHTKGTVTRSAEILITVEEKEPEKEESTNPGPETGEQESTKLKPETEAQNQPVKVSKIVINAPSKKLAAGKKVQLAVAISPSNAANTDVTWKTSNSKYATVSKKGKLTLKKAGIGKTVTITATAKDDSGKKASIKIKIMKGAVKSIKITAPKKTLKAGKTMTLKKTIKTTGKNVNKTLTWKSSNTKYATVNKKGKVTAKKAGRGKTVTITAVTTDGSNKKASIKLSIV